jgi:hypothetical protein
LIALDLEALVGILVIRSSVWPAREGARQPTDQSALRLHQGQQSRRAHRSGGSTWRRDHRRRPTCRGVIPSAPSLPRRGPAGRPSAGPLRACGDHLSRQASAPRGPVEACLVLPRPPRSEIATADIVAPRQVESCRETCSLRATPLPLLELRYRNTARPTAFGIGVAVGRRLATSRRKIGVCGLVISWS